MSTTVKKIYKSLEYGPAPEDSSEALKWLKGHGSKFNLFIGGKWVKPSQGEYFKTINPANGKSIANISLAKKKDIDRAVKAAQKASPYWLALSPHKRSRLLYTLARLIQKNARLLAVLETLDNGKPIRETRDIDIPLVARHFYHHAGWAQLMHSEFKGYQGLGVVGQIIPWNFPLLMLSWKIAPALAAGNTVVLKPAEQTPLTALLFAELCEQAGIPPGVVNIVTGDGRSGELIVNHPKIAKVAFTGSTEVGRLIRKATAGSRKKLSLELGGKSPFIVFEDADLDSAVEGIVDAIWFNQGEVCCAGSRLLVQENIADKLIRKIKDRMSKLRVGNPLDKSVDLGAIISKTQLKTIGKLVEKGEKEGGIVWKPPIDIPATGNYLAPILFTGVAPSDTICQEEIFGPVLVSMTFRTHDEAVKLANNTRYGLAASVWTENIDLALDIAPRVKAGTVWINSTNSFDAAAGFGGYRESGFGREGGREGMYEYMKLDLPIPKILDRKTSAATTQKAGSPIDRTPKLYIGGSQVRPDGGYSSVIMDPVGKKIGDVGKGNRKDIRNAVEAAHKAGAWASMTGHQRAQILYFIAENLSARHDEFSIRLIEQLHISNSAARKEVDSSIERIFHYAALADKYDGKVHSTVKRNITLAMPEPVGVIGVACPDSYPLLGFLSVILPLIAMGNTVVAIPSMIAPFSATDFYQVIDTSDLPGGVVNIVTGDREELASVLASHMDVDGVWYFGSEKGSQSVEALSISNMKRTWVNYGEPRNWENPESGSGEEFLKQATQIKNIWIPYGA